MTTQFLLLFYLRYNQFLLSYFIFLSFVNYYRKMVIWSFIVYLFCYLHFFIYVNISLFHWVYFTSFFDHYIKPNICFKPLADFLQNSCSKSVLNKLKNVPVKESCSHYSCRLQVCNFTKTELLHWYFSKILIMQLP